MRTSIVGAACAAILVVGSIGAPGAQAAAPQASEIQLLSASTSMPPGDANASAQDPQISSDGSTVVFSSKATDLTSPAPSGTFIQIYLRDVASGSTQLISTSSSGPGNGDSRSPVISADGRYVAYVTAATNLAPGTRSPVTQVVRWTRSTGATELISANNDPVPLGANGNSSMVAMSADGQTLTFASAATDLTAEATLGVLQIYERRMSSGRTTMVSLDTSTTPAQGAANGGLYPSITADGMNIAFSTRSRLTSVDTRGAFQVYISNRRTGSLRVASFDKSNSRAGGGESTISAFSADGSRLAFQSKARDLTHVPTGSSTQVYVLDIASENIELASVNAAGTAGGNDDSTSPALSADGSVVAFSSTATDITDESDQYGGVLQIYARDLSLDRISLLSVPSGGAGFANSVAGAPSISGDGTLVSFCSTATNLVPGSTSGAGQVYLRNVTPKPRVDRIGGADRYAVSAAVSADRFGSPVPVAFIASGEVFPDALSGSAAAGRLGGPVLLVTKNSIPAAVATELRRLQPKRIVVLGGLNSIAASVETALTEFSTDVSRTTGNDRFEVSAAIAHETFSRGRPVLYVASGLVFPDALSASAAAGPGEAPVLLVQKDSIPESVEKEIRWQGPSKIVVLGGVATISDAIVASLKSIAPTTRVAGTDRFEVSAAISRTTFTGGAKTVYIASGAVFPDALSGSAAAIKADAPVLLVTKDGIPDAIVTELERLNPTRIVVLGGQNTVSETVMTALDAFLER